MKAFTIPGSQLAMGASLGNSAVWIHTKGDGAIERVFLTNDAVGVALRKDDTLVVLVGNTGADTVHAPIQFTGESLLPGRATCRVYNSERQGSEDRGVREQTELRAMGFSIERGGFRILEIRAAGG